MTLLPEPNYTRTVLYQTDCFEIVSCEWTKNSKSPLHTHEWSECYVLIQRGVFENYIDLGIKTELSISEAGQVISTPLGAEHEIKCISETGKTLHVYIPKISDHLKQKNLRPASLSKIKSETDIGLSEHGIKWEQLTAAVEKVQSQSISTYSPFFMNQLFSGILPEMLLADEVIAKTKSTMATFEASPSLTLIEIEVIQNLGKLIGWSEEQTEGVTVPGGSAANFMALHCARQRRFPDYKTNGLPANTKINIFVSEDAHYSFKKACAVLGFGTNSLITVKVNKKGRMLVSDLAQKIDLCLDKKEIPLFVCATAGTTVLGAFDPIDEISQICQKNKIWLHVDGAWGGPILFSKSQRHLIKGIEKVDSVTFDAHKLFGASLTCSFFITSDPKILLDANDVSGAEYLFHDGSEVIDRGRLSWQCGRKADAMSFWTIWKSCGTNELGQMVDRLLAVKNQSVEWIKLQNRLELISEPDFLNICVRIKLPIGSGADPKKWSLHVRNELRKKNLAMVNYSSTQEGFEFLRIILAHPKIDFKTVTQILNWALEIV